MASITSHSINSAVKQTVRNRVAMELENNNANAALCDIGHIQIQRVHANSRSASDKVCSVHQKSV